MELLPAQVILRNIPFATQDFTHTFLAKERRTIPIVVPDGVRKEHPVRPPLRSANARIP